ncbi:MAG TPA: hypothetical protein DEP91_09165 [Sphingomonas bacterium]|jgi:hypothetical protein|uniref:STAS/SEC14 domain-containing protein n=1 Tax=Sphingomonas bacterium TaxID=1895847 RepID=A0A3D0WCE2_9SPHN|nr:hypothetical protein [Sphingomonas bacterium]
MQTDTKADYSIRHDPGDRMLRITATGFWSAGLAAKFAADLLAQGVILRLRHGAFYTLADVSDAPVQPAGVVDQLAAMMPRALQLTRAPIAAIAGSILTKMQIERYLNAPNCRVFTDHDEAVAWMHAVGLPT